MTTTAELLEVLPLPERVRRIRKMLHVTQRQMADAIGIEKRTVIRIEQGNYRPRANTMALIEVWIERSMENVK